MLYGETAQIAQSIDLQKWEKVRSVEYWTFEKIDPFETIGNQPYQRETDYQEQCNGIIPGLGQTSMRSNPGIIPAILFLYCDSLW